MKMDVQNLQAILRSHFPLVVVETHEEHRALEVIEDASKRLHKGMYTWSVNDGIKNQLLNATNTNFTLVDYGDKPQQLEDKTTDPKELFRHIEQKIQDSIVVLIDFHPYLDCPQTIRRLKEVALDYSVSSNRYVLLSHALDVPAEVQKLCARFEFSPPGKNEIKEILLEEVELWKVRNKNKSLKIDREALGMLIRNLQGLSHTDVTRLIRNALHDDGAITQSDIADVQKAKYDLVSGDGALSFEYDLASFSEIGGFRKLKRWLTVRRSVFLGQTDSKLDPPKGVLLLGVQGCGKSLAAKAISGELGVPLIRLDMGAIYNKYVGETEKNIREALKAADTLAPCVLWMDEIEKGLETGGGDSGSSRRIMGTLLTWMAERKSKVFLVATSNDVSRLPPELMRKGRIDEVFFVDLPDEDIRIAILLAHLSRRDVEPRSIDVAAVAKSTVGFSGAELEQVVVSALYASEAMREALSTDLLLDEVGMTRPLSVLRAEDITQLRHWAEGRTVPVD